MLLRLYVNTNEYVGSLLVHSVVVRDAYTYALRLLEYPTLVENMAKKNRSHFPIAVLLITMPYSR